MIVDNTSPQTQIVGGPSGTTSGPGAEFTFAGSDNVSAPANLAFAWRLDGGPFGSYSTATSVTFSGLGSGAHIFEVKARDQAGNEDPNPASRVSVWRACTSPSPLLHPALPFLPVLCSFAAWSRPVASRLA